MSRSPRTPNHRLRALLAEVGMTQAAFARTINLRSVQRGSPTFYDRTAVAHWLAGTRPREPIIALVCDILTQRLRRPVTPEEVGLASPSDGSTARTTSDDPLVALAALAATDADPHRRQLVRSLVFRSTADVPGPFPDVDAATSTARQPNAPAEDITLQALESACRLYDSHLRAFGGSRGHTALASYLAEDATAWLHRSEGTPLSGTLTIATAQLTYLLAQLCLDAGSGGLAQRYHHIAGRLAAKAGDRLTYAITLRAISRAQLLHGYPRRARQLAERALAIAPPEAPPAARTFLLAQAAVTHARTNHPALAVRELDQAHELAARDVQGPGPFTSYPPAALAYQAGETLHALGDDAGSLDALNHSLRLRAAQDRRARALTLARIAEIHCQHAATEQACVVGHAFLDEAAPLDSWQAHAATARLRGALSSYPRTPRVRALLARLPSYSAVSPETAPPVRQRPVRSHPRPGKVVSTVNDPLATP